MTSIAPTAATPVAPRPGSTGLPPALPVGAGTVGHESARHKVTSWMEAHLGKAALPVAALAGGAAGATVGMLTLGVPGAVIGGAAGAFFGGVFFMAG
jgi:hypothetical protein